MYEVTFLSSRKGPLDSLMFFGAVSYLLVSRGSWNSYWAVSEYFQAEEGGRGHCEDHQLHCDGDKCVDPEEMCDGVKQCDSGVDEQPGICNKL